MKFSSTPMKIPLTHLEGPSSKPSTPRRFSEPQGLLDPRAPGVLRALGAEDTHGGLVLHERRAEVATQGAAGVPAHQLAHEAEAHLGEVGEVRPRIKPDVN